MLIERPINSWLNNVTECLKVSVSILIVLCRIGLARVNLFSLRDYPCNLQMGPDLLTFGWLAREISFACKRTNALWSLLSTCATVSLFRQRGQARHLKLTLELLPFWWGSGEYCEWETFRPCGEEEGLRIRRCFAILENTWILETLAGIVRSSEYWNETWEVWNWGIVPIWTG